MWDADAGQPLPGAVVEILTTGQVTETTATGDFSLEVGEDAAGPLRLRVTRVGYQRLDTLVVRGGAPLEIRLRPRPIGLDPLTVRVSRGVETESPDRAVFDARVSTGVISMAQSQVRALPSVGEPDLLRTLRGMPGIVALNDLSAELYVRGGSADQNVFLLDGARVFGPYHLFGVFGAFNPAGTGSARVHRTGLPSRWGGVLTSVVEIAPPDPAPSDGVLSLGLLSGSAHGRGLIGPNGSWNVAARRSWVDAVTEGLTGIEFPYAFHDVNATVQHALGADHDVRLTAYASRDRFRPFGDQSLSARWANHAGAIHWSFRASGVAFETTGWLSGYRASLVTGGDVRETTSRNQIGMGGVRTEARWHGQRLGIRAGAEVQAGVVDLVGAEEPGGYVTGRVRERQLAPSTYAEGDWWIGRFRLSPGLRVTFDDGLEVEPRLAARIHMGERAAMTVAAGRTHQRISALRDERMILPGPPFFILHPDSTPSSHADNLSAQFDLWLDRGWHLEMGGYWRAFRDIVGWRPTGSREVRGLDFDDGEAYGIELVARKQVGRLTGWVSYGWGVVTLETVDGQRYAPEWDRRHSFDAAAIYRPGWGLTLSARSVYGSGTPYRPFAGYSPAPRYNALTGRVENAWRTWVPYWSETRQRFPSYFRLDIGARKRTSVFGTEAVLFLSVTNLTGRENVLYYRLEGSASPTNDALPAEPTPGDVVLAPVTAWPVQVLPSAGLELRFR